jgi:phenylpropionate dioxygenase-like ring-hydroxylating dioxygenase large terminal subunit
MYTYFSSLFFVINLNYADSYNKFFNHWHCVGFKDNINFNKPFVTNIGDLPLVLWKDNNDKILSSLNICPHMGSKLDNAIVTEHGCLQCQYHGLNLTKGINTFGEVIEFQDKIHWAYKPTNAKPYSIPFFNNPKFVKSHIVIDMNAPLNDCAYNTMDVRHPEFVHSGLFGFGSRKPPTNVKQFNYKNGVGLEFDYSSNKFIENFNKAKSTHNFHIFNYPSFTWSKVSFNGNNLIISVDLLPISKTKTRWFVTICHDYFTDNHGMMTMKVLASKILFDDWKQMTNQYQDSLLKKEVLFGHVFKDEEVILWLNEKFKDYKYPNDIEVTKLYKDHKSINL